MLHLNFEENNNEYDENEVEHDNTLDKVKSLLSANLSKQELYIVKFKDSIKEKISIKESPSELDELFSTFAELVKYFGITFCELIKRDEELLNLLLIYYYKKIWPIKFKKYFLISCKYIIILLKE